jgi:hypothetical protein
MLKDTILSYINDDGNLVYINDLVSAFDNWQSALGIFLGASNYKFIDISMSNEMDSATFTSGTTQLIFKTSSSLPSLATGTIIIATCNKTFTVTEQNRATVYVWLSDVEQRSSETGQEYTAIKRALFSNTQPTGISEVATIDLTWAVGMDGYSFYHTYDWRANLVLPSSIGLSDIANGAVGTLKIADGAVTSEKIADGTISTPDIADGAVTSAKIGDYQVTERNIGLGSISNDALQSGSVSNEKIIDYSINSTKIAARAVTDIKLNLTPYFLGKYAIYANSSQLKETDNAINNKTLFETPNIPNGGTFVNSNNPQMSLNFTGAKIQSVIVSAYNLNDNNTQIFPKVQYNYGANSVTIFADSISRPYNVIFNVIVFLMK